MLKITVERREKTTDNDGMSQEDAQAVIAKALERRRAKAQAQRRWREKRRSEERRALLAVGHLEGCSVSTCLPGCLVSRFGPPPSGHDDGFEDPGRTD